MVEEEMKSTDSLLLFCQSALSRHITLCVCVFTVHSSATQPKRLQNAKQNVNNKQSTKAKFESTRQIN